MIRLSKRLTLVASMVRPVRALADIGTDHGYVPAYLLENEIIDFAYLADVREGPLQNARTTIEREGLTHCTELLLSNGLSAFTPGCCHDFVFAGMGGNLISDLLAAAPWVNEPGNHFVLQPQSHSEDLRRYLYDNGFEIIKEDIVKEGKHLYLAMEVEYTGKIEPHKQSDYYIGRISESKSACKAEYLDSIVKRLEIRKKALLENMADNNQNTMELETITYVIKTIEEA